MSKLQSVEVRANPFGKKPFLLGPDKPDLAIIDISVIDHLDPSFNPSDYPSLLSLEAVSCYDLETCDVSKCPGLLRLSIDSTNVSEIDLSNNRNLLILNLTGTKVTEVDLSPCPYLTEFYASHAGSINGEYRLKSIDTSKNPELQRLFVSYNFLNSLDVSQNPKLTDISAAYNNLTTLDIDNCEALINLDLNKNIMSFATLPLPRFNFHSYYYEQRSIDMNRSYKVGTELDFSSKVLREGGETVMGMFRESFDADGSRVVVEIDADHYSYKDGKVTLLKETTDSVYLAFHNSLFPEADMKTLKFIVKTAADFGKDNKVLNFRVNAAVSQFDMSVGMAGASEDNPKSFSVDFGDGLPVEFKTYTSTIPAAPNVSGAVKRSGNIVVYVPEGEDLTAVSLAGVKLGSVNLENAPELQYVDVSGCNLSNLSVKNNKYLTSLNADNNRLTALDLSCDSYDRYKVRVRNVSAANNLIAEFTLPDEPRSLRTLDLSNNVLAEILLYNTDNLTDVNLSGNEIEIIDLSHCLNLTTLDISDNQMEEIAIPEYAVIENLNIAGNKFTIPNLPRPDAFTSLVYAPQQEWGVPKIGPTANLNAQWLDVDGSTTEYKWYMAESGEAVPEGKITGSNGRFRFIDGNLGLVYCEFTHPLYPDFSGDKIYRSTEIQTAPIPENEVFSLTTLADGIGQITMASLEPNTLLYIDWTGTGDDLQEYILQPTYTVFEMRVYANANAKAYSYNETAGLKVLSIAAGPLEAIDVSGLSSLISFASVGSQLTLDKMKLPQSSDLYEMRIEGSQIDDIDLTVYPKLVYLALNHNKIKSFDASKYPNLTNLYLRYNELEEIILDNPLIWELGVDYNKLSEIDLSKLPKISQLWLSNNKFTEINFDNLPDLKLIDISANKFLFSTLPLMPTTALSYGYSNQAPVEIHPDNGEVDLSSQYMIHGTPTEYKWYIGTPYFDEEGNLYGEELVADEEYSLNEGVSSFNSSFRNVMCVMTNSVFPGLYLYTTFIDVEVSGIEEIMADETLRDEIYDLQGHKVTNPGRGIYIINGKKMLLR